MSANITSSLQSLTSVSNQLLDTFIKKKQQFKNVKLEKWDEWENEIKRLAAKMEEIGEEVEYMAEEKMIELNIGIHISIVIIL